MDGVRKAELKEQYKEMDFQAGVYRIRNLETGKVYVGSSPDIKAVFNRHRSELSFGGCRIRELQADWKALGADKFEFEVLDELKPAEGEEQVSRDDLAELEKLWLEKLQPWDERGYNPRPKQV